MSKVLIIIHRPRFPQFGAFLFPPTTKLQQSRHCFF
nr:MAG TPA: hypothetical protein [Caudoviricetes sp.]